MSNKDSFFALLTGVVIGAALGVLFAPKSGKETREDLKKIGLDLKEKGKNLVEEGKSVIEKKKSEFFGSKEN